MAIALPQVRAFEKLRWRAPALPEDSFSDDQVYAAAELVRLGMATRVTLVNVTLDPALPDAWEVRGTPVELRRVSDDRARMIAGPRAR
jgi:hypothetical protein